LRLRRVFFLALFLSLGLNGEQASKNSDLPARLDELFRSADYARLAETLSEAFTNQNPPLPFLLSSLERLARQGQMGVFEKTFPPYAQTMSPGNALVVSFYMEFYRKNYSKAAGILRKVSLDTEKTKDPNPFQSQWILDLDYVLAMYYRAARYADLVLLYEKFGAFSSTTETEKLYKKAKSFLPEGMPRPADDLLRNSFYKNDYSRVVEEIPPSPQFFYLIALLKTEKVDAYDSLVRNHPRKDYFLFIKNFFNRSGADFLTECQSPSFGKNDEELLRLKDLFQTAGNEAGLRETLIVLERLRLSADTNLENFYLTRKKDLPLDILEDAAVGVLGQYLLAGNRAGVLRFFRTEYTGLRGSWAKESFRLMQGLALRSLPAESGKKSGSETDPVAEGNETLKKLLLSSPDTFYRNLILHRPQNQP